MTFQKPDELLMAMALHALANNLAALLQCSPDLLIVGKSPSDPERQQNHYADE